PIMKFPSARASRRGDMTLPCCIAPPRDFASRPCGRLASGAFPYCRFQVRGSPRTGRTVVPWPEAHRSGALPHLRTRLIGETQATLGQIWFRVPGDRRAVRLIAKTAACIGLALGCVALRILLRHGHGPAWAELRVRRTQVAVQELDTSIGTQVRDRIRRQYRLVKHAGFLDVYQRIGSGAAPTPRHPAGLAPAQR